VGVTPTDYYDRMPPPVRVVVMLAISIDGGGLSAVKRFMDKKGYTIPALVNADMEIARAFGARGVPSTFVVDQQGMAVA